MFVGVGASRVWDFKTGAEHLFLGYELTQEKDFSEATAGVIDQELRRVIGEAETLVIKTLDKPMLDERLSQWLPQVANKADGKKHRVSPNFFKLCSIQYLSFIGRDNNEN